MTAAQKRKDEAPAKLSYVTAGVSGALILTLVGYLVFHAIRSDHPAWVEVEVVPEEAYTRNGLAYVPIDIRNTGEATAAQIIIETRTSGSGAVESLTIDYLAGGERQRIYVAASTPAEAQGMTARVVAFQEP